MKGGKGDVLGQDTQVGWGEEGGPKREEGLGHSPLHSILFFRKPSPFSAGR